MKRVFIYVPGILTFPGSSHNWSGRAVTHTHTRAYTPAEKVEYFCGPIGRAFGQNGRAEKLQTVLDYYSGWQKVLVGHSNGTDVILKALEKSGWPLVERLHLVCGACEADFNKNGLNDALLHGDVSRVSVYVAEKDQALALAHSLPGRALGYGTLGLHGPLNVCPDVSEFVSVTTWGSFGHSDCWKDENFEATMANFLSA